MEYEQGFVVELEGLYATHFFGDFNHEGEWFLPLGKETRCFVSVEDAAGILEDCLAFADQNDENVARLAPVKFIHKIEMV